MNKQKFFERLGISSDDFWQGVFCQREEDKRLLLSSKDMLITMISSAIQFNKYALEHFEKGKIEKSTINYHFFMCLKKQIKKATGKTWEEVLTIWNECQ